MKIYLNNEYIKESFPTSNEFQVFTDEIFIELENLGLLDTVSSRSATYDKLNSTLYIKN